MGRPHLARDPRVPGAADIGIAHLHINDEDLLADPEIALPMHLLHQLTRDGVIGSTVADHLAVMGFQDRRLADWRHKTAPELVNHLRDQSADGLILAPA